jgi:transcriptional regulator with XRE-family HTH domain
VQRVLIKEIMKEKGYSQTRLAADLGLSVSHLSNYVNGRVASLGKAKEYRLHNLLGLE